MSVTMEDDKRRAAIRRTTIGLLVIAVGIYVAFVASSVMRAGVG